MIYTTNAIESLNARFRRSVKARGHFPTEQAALKHLYLTICSLDPTGRGLAFPGLFDDQSGRPGLITRTGEVRAVFAPSA